MKMHRKRKNHYLNETNFLGIATEALPTAHEAILPDNGMRIPADTATNEEAKQYQIRQKLTPPKHDS